MKDVAACREITDELYPLAERNKFPWPLAYARFLRGWLTSQEGDRNVGIEQMLQAANEAPAAVLQPIVLTLIAEQQMLDGQFDDALGTLDRATREMNTQGNRFYEAEMMRMRGEILLARSSANADEAAIAFRQAMALAARQSCRPLELRAAMSLAGLLRRTGRGEEARNLLAPIYGRFTEGFKRPDLQAANTLLAELG